MKLPLRLALAVLALCATTLAAVLAVAVVMWIDFDAAERAAASALLQTRVVALSTLMLLVAAAIAIVFAPALRRLFGGPAKLAEEARILLGAHRAHRVRTSGDADLARLRARSTRWRPADAPAADAQRRSASRRPRSQRSAAALAALISELAQGHRRIDLRAPASCCTTTARGCSRGAAVTYGWLTVTADRNGWTGHLAASVIARDTGQDRATVVRHLAQLKKDGWVESHGVKDPRGAQYRLPQHPLPDARMRQRPPIHGARMRLPLGARMRHRNR